jgi:hypothetical protein
VANSASEFNRRLQEAQRQAEQELNRQLRAAQQRAEQELKRRVNAYNREVGAHNRKVEAQNRRAIDDYNRGVAQHNRRADAHNQRVIDEINRRLAAAAQPQVEIRSTGFTMPSRSMPASATCSAATPASTAVRSPRSCTPNWRHSGSASGSTRWPSDRARAWRCRWTRAYAGPGSESPC